MLRLFLIAWVGVAVSCGGAKPMAVKSEQPKTGTEPLGANPRDEIERLEAEITASRTKLELAEPGESEFPGTQPVPMGKTPALQDPTCKPAKTDACTTSCTLSDSICGNAEKICKLAVEMNDDWARGKCTKANKTCEASRAKCCGCQ